MRTVSKVRYNQCFNFSCIYENIINTYRTYQIKIKLPSGKSHCSLCNCNDSITFILMNCALLFTIMVCNEQVQEYCTESTISIHVRQCTKEKLGPIEGIEWHYNSIIETELHCDAPVRIR